jgi:ATP-dependent Clp protease adaptor protein ClpS
MISSNMDTEILEEVKIDEKIKKQVIEPGKYNVIFFNDNVTPMEWVVEILQKIFRHSEETAQNLMLIVHEKGSVVVGTYGFEIAEQKAVESNMASRERGFPLVVKVEEE